MDQPEYTFSHVARATGVDVGTLRSWFQRKHFRLGRTDAASPARGIRHVLTLRRALQIGVAAELVRNDVEPSRAFRAALDFSDFSGPLEAPGHDRDPGELFPAPAHTILALYHNVEFGVVIRADDDTPLTELLFPKTPMASQRSGVFVWVNQIDRAVREGLRV